MKGPSSESGVPISVSAPAADHFGSSDFGTSAADEFGTMSFPTTAADGFGSTDHFGAPDAFGMGASDSFGMGASDSFGMGASDSCGVGASDSCGDVGATSFGANSFGATSFGAPEPMVTGRWSPPNATDQQYYGELYVTINMGAPLRLEQAAAAVPVAGVDERTVQKAMALADADFDGRLNREEFAIAMHLIKRSQSGVQLPETLPSELMPSPPAPAPTAAAPAPPPSFDMGAFDSTPMPAFESASFEAAPMPMPPLSQMSSLDNVSAADASGIVSFDATPFAPFAPPVPAVPAVTPAVTPSVVPSVVPALPSPLSGWALDDRTKQKIKSIRF